MTRLQETLLSVSSPITAGEISERYGFDSCHVRRALKKLLARGEVRMCGIRLVRGKPTRTWMAVAIQPLPVVARVRYQRKPGSGVIAPSPYAYGYLWGVR